VRERRAYAARSSRQLAHSAVAEERLRIARELHDVVAHHIGVITVKAGVANHVLAVRPEEAGEALRVIESSSRTALTEMRQLLGVLRSHNGAPEPELTPYRDLSALPQLVARAAAAGVTVSLVTRRTEGLPEPVGLSAFSIVREAVTNVMKHAAPARCEVRLEADGGELRIDVTDDGRANGTAPRDRSVGTPRQRDGGTPRDRIGGIPRERDGGTPRRRPQHPLIAPQHTPTAGHGIVGMRERAALHGGECSAGPRPSGGFAVRARLPFTAPADDSSTKEPV
jgi:signal transduction histidine kinase